MKHPLALALALALSTTALPVFAHTVAPPAKTDTAVTANAANPFYVESDLSLQYPHFETINDADFAPAFTRGMADQITEIEAIANQSAKPTFDNTIVPLEKSGRLLGRATAVFFNLVGTDTNPTREKLQAEFAPKLSAHGDAITLNAKLFTRIKALYDTRDALGLDAESVRLVERYNTMFVRSGANLAEAQKTRLRAINSELAQLGTKFSQNVLAEVNASAITVDSRAELAGLSDERIAAAAEAAKSRKLDGKYVLTLLNTTGQPPLTNLDNRALRERLFKASVARGTRGNEFDNTAIVSKVVKLRAERSKMMGYKTYAHFVLEDETAKNPEAVNAMLRQLAPAAVANARRESADLQAMIDKEQKAKGQPAFKLEPWDWAYYAEKVRQEKFAFDESQLKPYFELNNVLENGVFYAATQFYGITFKQRTDLPKYHPDTTVYDVFDKDGKPLAIFISDMYARDSKRGGAWMNSYVDQNALFGTKPVVANHLNIPKPPAGKPTLMTWDEVTTLFHEFGHALHGIFSDVKYPYFSGTNVPRDFVEFPSQVNEMWADWPSVLANYAKHHETGEPMPQALLDKVLAASKFNQGFATTEYLGAAMLDQTLHQLPDAASVPEPGQVVAFEANALKSVGLDYAPVPPRYKTAYFSHIMGGYAAGYYAYIWSEVLDANTVEWIKQNGGLTRENGDRFRATLLSQGGKKDALQLFRDFTGKDAQIAPLLKRRGLDAPASDGATPSEPGASGG